MLQPLTDNVWTAWARQSFLALQVGTRMTVVRLDSGGLWLHSPIPIDDALSDEVTALGPVEHIVCPNRYHHLHAGPWLEAFPDALLHAPAGLARKRRDLDIQHHLSEEPHASWGEQLVPFHIGGCLLDETVFLHPSTRTLITVDIVENFHAMDHLPTRLYLRLGGIYQRPGWHPLARFVYRDRKRASSCIERILDQQFDRVVISHGELLTARPKDAIRQGLAWLL